MFGVIIPHTHTNALFRSNINDINVTYVLGKLILHSLIQASQTGLESGEALAWWAGGSKTLMLSPDYSFILRDMPG